MLFTSVVDSVIFSIKTLRVIAAVRASGSPFLIMLQESL